jgi:hypothetical protein
MDTKIQNLIKELIQKTTINSGEIVVLEDFYLKRQKPFGF